MKTLEIVIRDFEGFYEQPLTTKNDDNDEDDDDYDRSDNEEDVDAM